MHNKSCSNLKPLRSWIMLLTILLVTSTTLVPLGFGLNQNQIANAQQLHGINNNLTSSSSLAKQQQPNGTSFQMDNTTFSHIRLQLMVLNYTMLLEDMDLLLFYYMDGQKHGMHGIQ